LVPRGKQRSEDEFYLLAENIGIPREKTCQVIAHDITHEIVGGYKRVLRAYDAGDYYPFLVFVAFQYLGIDLG